MGWLVEFFGGLERVCIEMGTTSWQGLGDADEQLPVLLYGAGHWCWWTVEVVWHGE